MADDVQRSWRAATGDLRADSSARRLVELLPAHPVVSAQGAARLLGVSEQAARTALHELARRGVLVEMGQIVDTPDRSHDRGRPRRWWEAEGLLALLGP